MKWSHRDWCSNSIVPFLPKRERERVCVCLPSNLENGRWAWIWIMGWVVTGFAIYVLYWYQLMEWPSWHNTHDVIVIHVHLSTKINSGYLYSATHYRQIVVVANNVIDTYNFSATRHKLLGEQWCQWMSHSFFAVVTCCHCQLLSLMEFVRDQTESVFKKVMTTI